MTPSRPVPSAPEPAVQRDRPNDAIAGIDSRDLMRGNREVQIRHAGQVYRLRHTRNDKLILVK